MSEQPPRPEPASQIGLCARCRYACPMRSARGATFWRCLRADGDAGFTRYPPLPVHRCGGFEEGDAGATAPG